MRLADQLQELTTAGLGRMEDLRWLCGNLDALIAELAQPRAPYALAELSAVQAQLTQVGAVIARLHAAVAVHLEHHGGHADGI